MYETEQSIKIKRMRSVEGRKLYEVTGAFKDSRVLLGQAEETVNNMK